MPQSSQNRYIWLFAILFLVMLIHQARAEIPSDVEKYCTSFTAQECSNHSSWFMIDTCKSMIKCTADINENTLEFRGCRTILRSVFDDCKNYPSTLCYNNVAYDTSKSETCDEIGVRFYTIDACGNRKEPGPCYMLNTCKEVTLTPYTGTSIIVHEQCLTTAQRNLVVSSDNDVNEDNNDKDQEEKQNDGKRKSLNRDEKKQPTTYTMNTFSQSENKTINGSLIQEKTIGIQNKTLSSSPSTAASQRISKQSPSLWLIGGIALLLLLIIALISYWYFVIRDY